MITSRKVAYKAVFFDLDNTLYDADQAYAAALATVAIDGNGDDYRSAREHVKRTLGEGHVSARNRLLYFKTMLERSGTYSPSALLERTTRYETALSGHVASQWKRLKRDAIFGALKLKYTLGIITNENLRTQLIKMRAIDPDGRTFTSLTTSEEIGVEKPDPRIFLAALSAAGFTAEECVYVGDEFATDLVPAMELGLRVFHTVEFGRGASAPTPSGEATRIERLDDLERLLANGS